MADAGFRDYEREFQRLTDNIPKRLESVTQFENDAGPSWFTSVCNGCRTGSELWGFVSRHTEAQNAEIRRIESDITQAKQMVPHELALFQQ